MGADPGQGGLGVLKHYQLVREIGRGGMGVVYDALDRRDGTRVAVKVLREYLLELDPSFTERFEREAHVAALLRSPYTVHVLDTNERIRSFARANVAGVEFPKESLMPSYAKSLSETEVDAVLAWLCARGGAR